MRNSNTAAVGIKRTYVNSEFIGYRLRAAIPNNDGFKWGVSITKKKDARFYIRSKDVTSYKSPYLIAEGSDILDLTTKDVERFLKGLESLGFTEFLFEPDVIEIARQEFTFTA